MSHLATLSKPFRLTSFFYLISKKVALVAVNPLPAIVCKILASREQARLSHLPLASLLTFTIPMKQAKTFTDFESASVLVLKAVSFLHFLLLD